MSEMARYKPSRLSRARLREWLEECGPQPFATILERSRIEVSEIDEARLLAELEGHPALFTKLEHDRWGATPRAIYLPKHRAAWTPRRRSSGRRRRPGPPQSYRRPAPPAPPESGFEIRDGRLHAVVLPEDATVVGDRIVADLPLDEAEAAVPLGTEIVADHPQVDVFQRVAGLTVYRGRRSAVGARTTEPGRVRVVLGRAEDDRAPSLALPSSRVSSGPGSSLVPYRPGDLYFAELPETATDRSLALTPLPPPAPAAPNIMAEFERRARAMRVGSIPWSEFEDWLLSVLKRFDIGQRERCAVTVAGFTKVPPGDRIPVVQHLVDPVEASPAVATALVDELAEALTGDGSLARWALPMVATMMSSDPEGGLMVRGGRVCWNAGNLDEAFSCFVAALDAGQELESDDLVLCGLSAAEVGRIDLVEDLAQKALRSCAGREPRSIDPILIETAVHLITALSSAGRGRPDWVAAILELRVARNEVNRALAELEGSLLFDERLNVHERLQAMMALDSCEKLSELQKVCDLAGFLLWESFAAMADRPLARSLELLEILESMAGVPGKHSTGIRMARRPPPDEASASVPTDSSPDLAGIKIAVVGGLEAARRRIGEQLTAWGARVRYVAPSWESKVSEEVVRNACKDADLVLEMTSAMKHDASEILNGLKSSLGFERRRVWGGATSAVQAAAEWGRSLRSIRPAI